MRFFPFLLLMFLLPCSIFARILMQPYLQAVSENSVVVLVECDTRDTASVSFGPGQDMGNTARTLIISETTASPVTYVHKIRLSGLLPATRYFYIAAHGTSRSDQFSFYTAVQPGTPFRMVWMADCRTGTQVFRKISQLMRKADPMVAIYGGDLCMNGSYKSWKSEFFTDEQLDLISRVPFFNTPGNHEGWRPNTRAFTHNPDSTSGIQEYYSFDYGDIHVLSLNTEIPIDSSSQQYKFAVKDLAATRQQWKIVIAHEPAYCSGGHAPNKNMVELTKKVLEPAKVDMVIAGHSHFYQHNKVSGIHHFVPGSAGAPLYNPKKAYYTIFQAKQYHYVIMDVSKEKIKVFVYNDQNELLEMSELMKGEK